MTEKDLLFELLVLTARGRIEPSMQDQARIKEVFKQLSELKPDQQLYKFKGK